MKEKIEHDGTEPVSEFTRFDGNELLRLPELGLRAVGQRHVDRGARGGVWEIRCVPVGSETLPARTCRACGRVCRVRSSWTRRLVHTPVGADAVHLLVRVRRYECTDCARRWTDDVSGAADGGGALTERAVWWAVAGVVLDCRSVRSVALALDCSWGCVNGAVLAKGVERLREDASRLDGVTAIGVDEHVWRHTAHGDRYVTVVIDLTPRRDGGAARLLDMVEGRNCKAFKQWLEKQSQTFRDHVEVVAMDAFTGYKKAARETIPGAVEVLDPFHVVHLAADKMDTLRCRLQIEKTGRRGTKDDPLYRARRALRTTRAYLTGRQAERLAGLFADQANKPLEGFWNAYQQVISCYRCEDGTDGRRMMDTLISELNATPKPAGQPKELRTLARTLKRRRDDILAYFDHPGSSNGPTEAINGRLEHLRGIALGFRNINNYITRSLLHAGGFRTYVHAKL